MPYIPSAGELKTKPTQHSVKELLSIGIQPDILLCRTDRRIPKEERRKLSLFCNVRESAVIEARDVDNIYAVPEAYSAEGVDAEVLAAFGIEPVEAPDVPRWQLINERIRNPEGKVTIAIVGKYTGITRAGWSSTACASAACRPTACCPRSSNTPTTPGSSACSITPSSSRGRSRRTHCAPRSSGRRWSGAGWCRACS